MIEISDQHEKACSKIWSGLVSFYWYSLAFMDYSLVWSLFFLFFTISFLNFM